MNLSRLPSWLVVIVITPLAVLIYGCSERLVWNITDSVDHRVAYLSDAPAGLGDYVHFEFSHSLIQSGAQVKLTKRIACLAGQRVNTIDRLVFCDNFFLGKALEFTASGQPLSVFKLDGPIPDGFVMVSGDSEDSFDSRYWGLIDVARLHKVIPLI